METSRKTKIQLTALLGLVVSFGLPASGQRKDPGIDPQIVQQLHSIGKDLDDAFLKGDAAAMVACFTEDAILVSDSGPVYGRRAVEKYYAEHFREVRYVKHETTDDPASARRISGDGDVIWENGEWIGTLFLQGEDCGPHQVRGYFTSISIREGNTWRIRMFTFSTRILPPTATANTQ
jgi:ketosteroid isomerase-like protein